MPRLRRVARMCSRTVSGTADRPGHGSTLCSPTVEKILCRTPISERSPVSGLRQAKKQRETGVKRVETAGVYPLAPSGQRIDNEKATENTFRWLFSLLVQIETLLESVNTSACINELLLAGIELALRTDFNLDVLLSGQSLHYVAAVTSNSCLVESRMDSFLHDSHLFLNN